MKPLSDVVFGLYRGTPEHEEWVIACLEGAWPNLIGDRLATVCRPHRFGRGRLVIEVTDPAWNDALRAMRDQLCDKIRAATGGEVRQIAFREPSSGPRTDSKLNPDSDTQA